MAYNITSTTEIDVADNVMYQRVLLDRALPKLLHALFAQVKDLPTHSGNQIKWRRYTSLGTSTVPLEEGVTPSAQQLAKTDLTAQVSYHGGHVMLTDIVMMENIEDVKAEAVELLSEQYGLTHDTLIRDVLVNCASSTNASNGSNGQSPTEPAYDDLEGVVVTSLLGNDAEFISSITPPGTGVGSMPVRESFFAISHTDLIPAIQDVDGFISTSQYPSRGDVMMGEWGATPNVRHLFSTNADKTAGTPDQYNMLIFAKNAYGIQRIGTYDVELIWKGLGDSGSEDPYNQRASMAWKRSFACRILNDNFMHRLVCTNQAGT